MRKIILWCFVVVVAFGASKEEIEGLNALYIATNGKSWKQNARWGEGDPCENVWRGVFCNKKGEVIRVMLADNNLLGTLPKEINKLKNLTDLELGENKLTGAIPKEIGELSNLTYLSLYGNELSSAIPKSIKNLKKLSILSLKNNQLSGSIPKEIGEIDELSVLDIENNLFSGFIPQSIQKFEGIHIYLAKNSNLKVSDEKLSLFLKKHVPPEDRGAFIVVDGKRSDMVEKKLASTGHDALPQSLIAAKEASLLGVDANKNGVRDDVERWIYEKYQDKHPVHIDIAMQAAKAYKKVLEAPKSALDIVEEVNAFIYCEIYFQVDERFLNEPILEVEKVVDTYFKEKIYFNTPARKEAYKEYKSLLKEYKYVPPKFEDLKSKCDFDTSKYH